MIKYHTANNTNRLLLSLVVPKHHRLSLTYNCPVPVFISRYMYNYNIKVGKRKFT